MATTYDPKATEDFLVCNTCGTQFPTADRGAVKTCFICDDPRQYTPPSGQSFTTLGALRGGGGAQRHRNEFHPWAADPRLVSILSAPRIAIGQRAILVRTPAGNVLWDCVTLLDDETIERIRGLGGLGAIVVSHPHFYSTHPEWARAFGCPVYLAAEDRGWVAQRSECQVFIDEPELRVRIGDRDTGVVVVKLGGHFPGSLVALFDGRMLTADTLMTTRSGVGSWSADAVGEPRTKPPGLNTFAFLWSIPNFIPLSADEILRMWGILKHYDFRSTHGLIFGDDIEDENVKARVLESMQIQVKHMGWDKHALLAEEL